MFETRNVSSVCSNERVSRLTRNHCCLLISYANSLDSISPTKCWARSEFKLLDTNCSYLNKYCQTLMKCHLMLHFTWETVCKNVCSVCSNERVSRLTSFVICWYPMQTVWTQPGPTKCWARSKFKLFDADAIPERISIKRRVIPTNMNRWQKHAKLSSKIKVTKSLAKITGKKMSLVC